MEKVLPEGKFDETARQRQGVELESRGEEPGTERLGDVGSVSLYIPSTNQYVNINSDGWAVIQDDPVTTYVIVPYSSGESYIVVGNGSYATHYLSYNDNDYVGAYSGWNNACWWSVSSSGAIDCVKYPGLYPYGDDYLCVNGVEDAPSKVVTVIAKAE